MSELPHLSARVVSEFYAFLLARSLRGRGDLTLLDGETVRIDVGDGIALALPGEDKPVIRLGPTGEIEVPELFAALQRGRQIHALPLRIERDSHAFEVTLVGQSMKWQRVRLPSTRGDDPLSGEIEEIALYEILHRILAEAFATFATRRTDETRWTQEWASIQGWAKARTRALLFDPVSGEFEEA